MTSSTQKNKHLHHIIVASYTNSLTSLLFDSSSLSLTQIGSIDVGFHPSWVTAHPEDPSVVFTGLEEDPARIIVVKYDSIDEAGGTVKAEVVARSDPMKTVDGGSPCHLIATKDNELLVANYIPGSLTIFPISPHAPYFLSPQPKQIIRLSEVCKEQSISLTGPNSERQEQPHAHQVVLHGDELLVADLGTDKVWRLKRAKGSESDGLGEWRVNGYIDYPAGGGPRHLVIRDNHLYTLLELSSELCLHMYPTGGSFITSTPTLRNPPPKPNTLNMLAAEILIPPPNSTYTEPYIYISNRNDPHPQGDTIAIFTHEHDSHDDDLLLENEVRTGLNHLRGMVFGGEDDRFLIAGGANGGGVKVFERIEGGRGLKEVASVEVEKPTGFVWV